MTLFIASDEPHEPSGFNQLGWAGLAEQGVTIVKVAGDHDTMMNEPHVRVLGSKITQCMAEYTNEVHVSSEKLPAAGCPILTERTHP